ncbi:MAG: enoyl-CoA hydratase/isomerase family protein [Pseudodonghicola sp.]
MTAHSHLKAEIAGGVLRLVLNRPDKLNALTHDIYRAIGDAVIAAAGNPEVSVITLQGAGRAFSSGFDLKLEVADKSHATKLEGLAGNANRTRWAIWNSPKPVIAAVHGYCLAGAFEMMLPCDLTIAARSTVLGEPEILFGAGPAFLMVPWMTSHKRAKDILLTGRHITAAEALDMGFVSRVVEDDALEAALEETVATLLRMAPHALAMVKRGVNRAYEGAGMSPHLDAWAETGAYMGYISDEEGSEFKTVLEAEGVSAALEWRRRRFDVTAGDRGGAD